MSLKDWAANGWLKAHQCSRKEVAGLLSIVDRDLKDAAEPDISADWRFGIAYNAGLKLCTILMHASGYRPEKTLQHYRTLQALPLILGEARKADAAYLDTCRIKRNTVEYTWPAPRRTREAVSRHMCRTNPLALPRFGGGRAAQDLDGGLKCNWICGGWDLDAQQQVVRCRWIAGRRHANTGKRVA